MSSRITFSPRARPHVAWPEAVRLHAIAHAATMTDCSCLPPTNLSMPPPHPFLDLTLAYWSGRRALTPCHRCLAPSRAHTSRSRHRQGMHPRVHLRCALPLRPLISSSKSTHLRDLARNFSQVGSSQAPAISVAILTFLSSHFFKSALACVVKNSAYSIHSTYTGKSKAEPYV